MKSDIRLKRLSALALCGAAVMMSGCNAAAPASSAAPAAPTAAATPAAAAQPAPPKTAAPNQQRIAAIVKELMEQQYGKSFDAKHSCWTYTLEFNGDSHDYCMRADQTQPVEASGQTQLYIAASNVADINDDPRYVYSQVDSGLMGAFQLAIDAAGQWTVLAASKDLDFGTIGDCGCRKAEFVRLGAGTYGWKFTSGGVWQGVAVTKYSLVAPRDKSFKDLSAIPRVTESDQGTEYSFSIDASDPAKAMYPLLVTRKSGKTAAAPVRVEFDPGKGRYELPAAH
jgi:hypothetical protein